MSNAKDYAPQSASLWRKPTDELPQHGQCVLIFGMYGYEPVIWNEYYQCWDDVEGYYFKYEASSVKYWMPIPKLPNE